MISRRLLFLRLLLSTVKERRLQSVLRTLIQRWDLAWIVIIGCLDGTSWNDFSGVNQYVAICNAADRDLVMTMYPKTDDSVKEAMYLQPSQYFTIAETSEYKDEAAAFVDWFINSEEANLILMGERGTPANTEVAAVLSESVDERTKVVFDFMDEVSAIAYLTLITS